MTDLIKNNLIEAVGVIFILVVAWSIYRANRNEKNTFNLLDLLMENGRVSKVSFVFMGSWATLTYVFVGMYATGKMTEGLYTAFGAICFAPIIARMFAPPIAPSTTTTTTASTNTTEVK